ncbi:hypothetical protein, partial [Streptomyces sp. NPDC088785]|uniref:hypothetical protein n=1 Tax=Streptomyces sp. NPDC088785 TaxID=3365897 RepID=UPI00382EC0FE
FGTLLSSQGTDASFVLTLSGFPPGASLRSFLFPTLSDRFTGRFPRGFASLSDLSAFRRVRLYQILSGLIPSQRACLRGLLGRSDVSNFSGSLRQFLIEVIGTFATQFRIEFGHAEDNPALGDRAGV